MLSYRGILLARTGFIYSKIKRFYIFVDTIAG